jgi:hypothetical protein
MYAYGFEDGQKNGAGPIGHSGGAPGMNGELKIYPQSGWVVTVLSNLDPRQLNRCRDLSICGCRSEWKSGNGENSSVNAAVEVKRPWFAIVWFCVWALFQTFAVVIVLLGRWRKPGAFPNDAYFSLIYPDMVFIPVYYGAVLLLTMRHPLGFVFGFLAGGAMTYVFVYLLALAHLHGTVNVIADTCFLICTLISALQLVRRSSKFR